MSNTISDAAVQAAFDNINSRIASLELDRSAHSRRIDLARKAIDNLEIDRAALDNVEALRRHVSDHDRELAQATLTARDNAGKLSQLANGVYRDVQNMQSMAELLREIRKVIDMFDDRIAHLETRIGNLDNDLDGQSLNIVAVNVRLDEHHQMLWSLENTKENKHEQ